MAEIGCLEHYYRQEKHSVGGNSGKEVNGVVKPEQNLAGNVPTITPVRPVGIVGREVEQAEETEKTSAKLSAFQAELKKADVIPDPDGTLDQRIAFLNELQKRRSAERKLERQAKAQAELNSALETIANEQTNTVGDNVASQPGNLVPRIPSSRTRRKITAVDRERITKTTKLRYTRYQWRQKTRDFMEGRIELNAAQWEALKLMGKSHGWDRPTRRERACAGE